MGQLTGIAAALALIAYLGFWGGLVEFFFPAAPQASTSPSSEVSGSAVLPLSFPIPYDISIAQSGDGIDVVRARYYVAPSHR